MNSISVIFSDYYFITAFGTNLLMSPPFLNTSLTIVEVMLLRCGEQER